MIFFWSDIKWTPYMIYWIFEKVRHFYVTVIFLSEVISEVEYTSEVSMSIPDVLNFWLML